MSEASDPSGTAIAVTASDSTSLLRNGNPPRGIYVGVAGAVAAQFGKGVTVTFAGVPAGTILPIRPNKIMAATTASSIVALY